MGDVLCRWQSRAEFSGRSLQAGLGIPDLLAGIKTLIFGIALLALCDTVAVFCTFQSVPST